MAGRVICDARITCTARRAGINTRFSHRISTLAEIFGRFLVFRSKIRRADKIAIFFKQFNRFVNLGLLRLFLAVFACGEDQRWINAGRGQKVETFTIFNFNVTTITGNSQQIQYIEQATLVIGHWLYLPFVHPRYAV